MAYNKLEDSCMKNTQLLKVANSAILCLQKYTPKESLERQTEAVVQNLRALRFQDLAVSEKSLQPRGIGYRNVL